MTGPLAQQIAQVRKPLEFMVAVLNDESCGDALAALSAIERHVQDMEKELRELARMTDDAMQHGSPLPSVDVIHRKAVAALDDLLAAALPASGTPEGDAR